MSEPATPGRPGPVPLPEQGPAPEVPEDPWVALRRHTRARIALGRSGISLPTRAHLNFAADHALARDAVHHPLDAAGLAGQVARLGQECLRLHSAAADRGEYLRRPDRGRQLDDASRELLAARTPPGAEVDLAIVLADGLSALALERQAVALLTELGRRLEPDRWTLGPVCLVEQGRVAIGDEIGAALGARLVVVLIGERPGLSSPDSLGVYLTWAPRPGRTDAERNCISNVRPEGLPVVQAAERLHWLLEAARQRQLSGVDLKDESAHAALPGAEPESA